MSYLDSFTFKSKVVLKNKVILAPMTVKMSFHNGDVTMDELAYYRQRSGDIGAVITGAANVSSLGKGWEGEVSAESDEHLDSLKSLAKAIQVDGTKAIIQLFHAGRMTNSKVLRERQPVSASAIAALRDKSQVPRALSEDEILEVIEDFKEAVVRSYEAGFDGVELHGANTYLIQQFFSPHSNRRSDQWGGSLENRYRFINILVDSVLRIRESFERPFVIGYRFSPEEFENPGITLKDTLYLVSKLADKDLDYLHISLNDYDRISISDNYQDHSILYYIYKEINGRLPLIGVGNVKGKKDLKQVLENADLVAVGSALLADPKWFEKVRSDKEELINKEITKDNLKELNLQRFLL